MEPMPFARSMLLCLATCLLLSSCASLRPATVPLRTIEQPAPCTAPADTLLVLLPGSYSMPEDFVREGFVQTIRERQLAADVLLVDAHVGYYNNRSIITRLRDDVVRPARARGYKHVWLVGISIGAVGAMLYADAQPGDVDGMVLIAPFLGSYLSAQEIRNAGGLAVWRSPDLPSQGDIDLTLWRWLQAQTNPAAVGGKLPLYLGYGLDDRFAFNDKVLSQAMPPSQVFTAEGGHDWPAWRVVWRQIVATLPLARNTACQAPHAP